MSKKGRYMKAKPAGGGWKKVLLVFAVLLLLLVIIACGLYFYLNAKLERITQAEFVDKGTTAELDAMAGVMESTETSTLPEETTEPPVEETTEETTVPETSEVTEATEPDYGESGKIVNIMVVGQDMRAFEEHKLADTIMLFTLNKETRTLTVTSFLRDSYVNLPDYYRGHTCGWNRINTAYALGYGWFGDAGAMDMLNVTIQNNYGIEIDGNVEISLSAFQKAIDLFGGVDIVLEGDELTYMNDVVDAWRPYIGDEVELRYFEEGNNHLNGMEALWYARMRHSNGSDNDVKRAARQRLIIDKVLGELKSLSILELNHLLDEILPEIVTNISTDDMKMYIRELLPYIFDLEMVSNQCPAEGTYWGEMVELPDGLSGVLKIDFAQNMKLMQAICEENA